MPLCVTCAHPAAHLYTVYKTRSNIRLGVCTRCNAFLDPLIEHPPLLHLLDLVLLKPRVFLHLLYNRGTLPFLAASSPASAPVSGVSPAKTQTQKGDGGGNDGGTSKKSADACAASGREARHDVLRGDMTWLVVLSICAETLVRCQMAATSETTARRVASILVCVMLELCARLGVSTGLALLALWPRGWLSTPGPSSGTGAKGAPDGRRLAFHPIIIPLTLLYTSLLPLLLHLLLGIWYDPPSDPHPPSASSINLKPPLAHALNALPAGITSHLVPTLEHLVHIWHTSDRIWIGTRLLGGMSAGFGLRVVLPLRPIEVTAVVLGGWAAAAGVSALSQA